MADTNKTVLILRVSADADKAQELAKLLEAQGFSASGCVTDASDSDENTIKAQVDEADAVAVLVSPNVGDDVLINSVIEHASMKIITVVGVWCAGAKESDLPSGLKDYGDGYVEWSIEKIIAVINGENLWQEPGGGPRPEQNIKRHDCGTN
ncbi:MAG: hypothetical protein ACYYKD_03350 [Rhodospirillales bacterium]